MNQELRHTVRESFIELSIQDYDSLADKVNAIKRLNDSLGINQRTLLENIVVDEFMPRENLRTYCIMLAGALNFKSAQEYLLDLLQSDEKNRPIIMLALGEIKCQRSYEQIREYLEMHKHQTLQALAMIDYERVLPLIRKEIKSLPDKNAYELLSCIFINMIENDDYNLIIQKLTRLKSDNQLINQTLAKIFAEAVYFANVNGFSYSEITKLLLSQ